MSKKLKGHLVQVNDPNDDVAIRAEGVSKSFKLPHNKQSSLKGALINLVGRGDRTYETQEVLKNISFEIKKGEFFGIVGRNGSGKSTLLKMLAGIYTPSAGKIIVNGSLTPFIELGVGFNPELTGRENVYLNGALLGFNEREVDEMYDDIVDFAELERFMDQKLKNYSSGMQVRLAFSIAIRARSDILLLDEVLAVGDEAFQRKCTKHFSRLKKSDTTVILVTHDMNAVLRFCDKAMIVSDGKIVKYGSPKKVAEIYNEENDIAYAKSTLNEDLSLDNVRLDSSHARIEVINDKGEDTKRFYKKDRIYTKLIWDIDGVKHAGVALIDSLGRDVFSPNTFQEGMGEIKGRELGYSFIANISPGEYQLKAALFGEHDGNILAKIEGPVILVERGKNDVPYVGITELEHKWEI